MTIETVELCKSYDGKEVLKNLSLEIGGDSVIALCGAHGSGKTTFLRILLGLEKPDSGQVNLLGDYKYAFINAGMVFQEDRLIEGLSAAENVALVNAKLSKRVAAEELLKVLPEGAAEKKVGQLSPGQRAMVCIVRACIVPSDVRLMDDPFRGMDEPLRKKAEDYILSVRAHTGLLITSLPGKEPRFCRPVLI